VLTQYLFGTNRLDRMTGSKTVNFDHDPQGNLVGRTFVTGGPTPSAQQPEYGYAHDGRRITKTVGAEVTVYHYDLFGHLIAETDGSGSQKKVYIYLENQPLAMIGADGSVYYFHNDHLGTPQRLTDASGSLAWSADYLPFGKADVTLETIENNLRFPGQYFDAETGLHYNYHRYYDWSLGRYVTPDPIGHAGGVNLYAYSLLSQC
jgi:RHS repeat-associated protein